MTRLIERRAGPYGEVALRRRGDDFEIIANGCFLMDSADGRSERLLISAALDVLGRTGGVNLLIGGLGVGFSLAEASADPRPGRISVVERERAVIDWHVAGAAPLRPFAGGGHDDPRTEIVHDELLRHLRAGKHKYDALCLDIDNGPDWTVTDDNLGVYSAAGLDVVARGLTDGGVLSVWSATDAPEFRQRLASRFAQVTTLDVPLPPGRRGEPDVIILASRKLPRPRGVGGGRWRPFRSRMLTDRPLIQCEGPGGSMEGFKKFLLRGNLVDLAIAVVIGAAFGAVVTSLVKDLITPLIAAIGGQPDFSNLSFTINKSTFKYGDFFNALIAFAIIAAVIYFLVLSPVNRLITMMNRKKEATERACPECLSEIPVGATRCKYCTAVVAPAA